MSSGVGRDDFKVSKLEDGAVENESQSCGEKRLGSWQKNAGHDDDQRIEEVE